MKTPGKPPEKNQGKVEENASQPESLSRFRHVAREVLNVPRDKVVEAEKRSRREKDKT